MYICSRKLFEKHTDPRAYSKNVPGAVCISNMVLGNWSILDLENSFRYMTISRGQNLQKAKRPMYRIKTNQNRNKLKSKNNNKTIGIN